MITADTRIILCGKDSAASASLLAKVLAKVLHNRLSEEEALRFAETMPECLTFMLLILQQRIAAGQQASGQHTPSGAVPPYAKENTSEKTAAGKENSPGSKKKRHRTSKEQAHAQKNGFNGFFHFGLPVKQVFLNTAASCLKWITA